MIKCDTVSCGKDAVQFFKVNLLGKEKEYFKARCKDHSINTKYYGPDNTFNVIPIAEEEYLVLMVLNN